MDQLFSGKGVFNIDTENVINTCVNQFSDSSRWIVELLLNSYDANAKKITVSGSESDDSYSVIIKDDGHGMDEYAAEKCITKFASIKESENAVGEFGLGLIAVGHDKSQRRMVIFSKTIHQCNEIEIDGNMVTVPRITIKSEQSENPETGTNVCVEFNKPAANFSLRKVLIRLKDYAESILEYLPAEIVFEMPAEGDDKAEHRQIGNKNWYKNGYQYSSVIDNLRFDIAISTGKDRASGVHAYHKKVLVTKSFSPLQLPSVPYVQIRINSDNWILPIGRDNIIVNEKFERTLEKLKKTILDNCYTLVFNGSSYARIDDEVMESITISLLNLDIHGPWLDYPVFKIFSDRKPYLSYNDFKNLTVQGSYIYFLQNSTDATGIDFHKIYPIIDPAQRNDKISLINERFKEHIRSIQTDRGIYILPAKDNDLQRERLRKYLKFDFVSLFNKAEYERKRLTMDSSSFLARINKIDNLEAKTKNETLLDKILKLKFDTGYLFNSSNSSPNTDYKFYYNNDLVVFNLNHSSIQQLIRYRDPKLAAHRALCIALSEGSGILHDLKFNALIVDAVLAADLLSRFKSNDTEAFNKVINSLNDLLNRKN